VGADSGKEPDVSWQQYVQIFIVVGFLAGGQLLFRKTAVGAPPLLTWDGMTSLLVNPFFLLALALYAIATLLWVSVLQHVPLSRAYAFNALSFIAVPVASILVFGEQPTLRLGVGLVLVVAGLILIGARS
jgi:undecaprenyl phosphate-alpha-L-ara4N flippase subunit ArnE